MGLFARLLAAIGRRKHELELDERVGDGGDSEGGAEGRSSDDTAALVTRDDFGSDPERDLELEAKDDPACFEFGSDIARYFTAEFRIEQAWSNLDRRAHLFSEYQVRDAAHWYQVKATFERWLGSPEGKRKYPSPSALMQARMTTTQTVTVDELEAMIADAREAKL